MSRIDNIAMFAQKRDAKQMEEDLAALNQIEEYKKRIRALKPRIDELIRVGNACLEHGIPLTGESWGCHQGYDTHQFISNGWSHLCGFIQRRDMNTREILPFTQVGKVGGGACNYNLATDGETVEVTGDAAFVMNRFLEDFDEFETEFYKYVDKVTGQRI